MQLGVVFERKGNRKSCRIDPLDVSFTTSPLVPEGNNNSPEDSEQEGKKKKKSTKKITQVKTTFNQQQQHDDDVMHSIGGTRDPIQEPSWQVWSKI